MQPTVQKRALQRVISELCGADAIALRQIYIEEKRTELCQGHL